MKSNKQIIIQLIVLLLTSILTATLWFFVQRYWEKKYANETETDTDTE